MAISLVGLCFAIVFDAAKSKAHKDSAKIQEHLAQKHIHAAPYKALLDYSVFCLFLSVIQSVYLTYTSKTNTKLQNIDSDS